MLNEIRKLAYCSGCGKNVPHRRKVEGVVDGLLQALRIGPWFCLHCEQKRMVLPAVRGYAADDLNVLPEAPNDFNKQEIWSSSGPVAAESVDRSEWDFSGGFDDEQHDTIDESVLSQGDRSNGGLSRRGQTRDSYKPQLQHDTQIGPKVSLVADGQQAEQVDISSRRPSIILEEADRRSSAVRDSERDSQFESEVVTEAEPVGNFIKDQSLVLQSARLHRFTEKFRDSVVDRILAGKVSIGSLTADGDYSESELLSWIADKARRQEDKTDGLELDSGRS